MAKSPAWTRKEGQNPNGGLNAKGRASAKKEGHDLKPPVKKNKQRSLKKLLLVVNLTVLALLDKQKNFLKPLRILIAA